MDVIVKTMGEEVNRARREPTELCHQSVVTDYIIADNSYPLPYRRFLTHYHVTFCAFWERNLHPSFIELLFGHLMWANMKDIMSKQKHESFSLGPKLQPTCSLYMTWERKKKCLIVSYWGLGGGEQIGEGRSLLHPS